MNVESSRSHAIFTVTVECSTEEGGRQTLRMGKLNLVDLAVGASTSFPISEALHFLLNVGRVQNGLLNLEHPVQDSKKVLK